MWWLTDVQTTNRLFWIQSRKHFFPAPLSFFKNNEIQKWTLVSLKLLIWCLSSISGQNKLILLLWFAIRNFQHNDQDDDSGGWWHYLQVLLKYTEYNEPHESLTNKNIIDVSPSLSFVVISEKMYQGSQFKSQKSHFCPKSQVTMTESRKKAFRKKENKKRFIW